MGGAGDGRVLRPQSGDAVLIFPGRRHRLCRGHVGLRRCKHLAQDVGRVAFGRHVVRGVQVGAIQGVDVELLACLPRVAATYRTSRPVVTVTNACAMLTVRPCARCAVVAYPSSKSRHRPGPGTTGPSRSEDAVDTYVEHGRSREATASPCSTCSTGGATGWPASAKARLETEPGPDSDDACCFQCHVDRSSRER